MCKRRNVERRQRLRKQAKKKRLAEFMKRKESQNIMFMFFLCCLGLGATARFDKLYWVKPRSCDWWDRVVLSTFTADDWLTNFRMSKMTFNYLCDKLSASIIKEDTVMRRAIYR